MGIIQDFHAVVVVYIMSSMNIHCYSEIDSKIGRLRIACSPKGIAAICLASGSRAEFENGYCRRFGIKPEQGKIPEPFKRAVANAAAGLEYDPVPIDLTGLSEFQLKVLKTLRHVRRGKVQTYSWLAHKVGNPKAARAVGNTMARNPVPLLVPCHRVVPVSGGTGNYGLGKARKQELLQREGVAIGKL
jgi:O-6-methylguanine DNA methyltransferase